MSDTFYYLILKGTTESANMENFDSGTMDFFIFSSTSPIDREIASFSRTKILKSLQIFQKYQRLQRQTNCVAVCLCVI